MKFIGCSQPCGVVAGPAAWPGLIRGILDARAGADLAPLEPGEVANHQAEIRSRSVNPN